MATAADAAREFASGAQVPEAARLLLSRFPLASLCEALANARPDDTEPLLAALERLAGLEEVRAGLLAGKVVGFLREGSSSPDPRIRRLVVRLLEQQARSAEGASQLVDAGFLEACERLLADEETGTAEAAAATIRHVVVHPGLREAVLGNGTGDAGLVGRLLGQLGSLRDVQRIRLLHLFVELGRSSQEVFAALEEKGAFKEVLDAFLTDDILLKLNAVELMDALGSYPSGQDLLSRQGVPERLAADLTDPMCDDSVRLCVTRLLGLVMRRAPAVIGSLLPNREAPMAQTLAMLLDSRDSVSRLCAVAAWANISVQPAGMAFFLGWPQLMQELVSLMSSPQNEVCKAAMASWAVVIEDRPPPAGGAPASAAVTPSADPAAQLWTVAERQLLPLVLKNLKAKPFPDVRTHTWQLLALLIRSRPAAQIAMPSEEMRDLLLDFTSETALDARLAKHAFVSALVRHHSGWLGAFLDEKVEAILEEYARQGPHWLPREAAAAVADRSGG